MKLPRISVPPPGPQCWADLNGGEYYRDAIEYRLRPWLGKMFGFHLLKVGNLSAEISTENCAISHQVNTGLQGERLQVIADPLHLPFATDSIDACLLAHTLPWCHKPHRLLREVDRVLIDDGWLMMSSFNPVSLMGCARFLPFQRSRNVYRGQMFSLMRQLDWLSLLNFEVLHYSRFHVLPWHQWSERLLNTHFPVFGCLQLLVARKRTMPLTPAALKGRSKKRQLQPVTGVTRQYSLNIKAMPDNPYPQEKG